jgi:hypothetical protein
VAAKQEHSRPILRSRLYRPPLSFQPAKGEVAQFIKQFVLIGHNELLDVFNAAFNLFFRQHVSLLLVRQFEKHVGVAWLVQRAPAGKVFAAKFFKGTPKINSESGRAAAKPLHELTMHGNGLLCSNL